MATAKQLALLPELDPRKDVRVLITVKTYPQPSARSVEVVCTAGITDDGKWIRLYPIPWRMLEDPRRYRKYQRIKVRAQRDTSDPRPESHKVEEDTLEILEEIDTQKGTWARRKAIVLPHRSASIEELQDKQKHDGTSLGLIRPRTVTKFFIRRSQAPAWTPAEIAKLKQASTAGRAPSSLLEKIPYEFGYAFECDDERCKGHEMQCLDWEVGESYRNFLKTYGASGWREKMVQKYWDELVGKCDLHFYMGTFRGHQTTWSIIGLFYPRKGR